MRSAGSTKPEVCTIGLVGWMDAFRAQRERGGRRRRRGRKRRKKRKRKGRQKNDKLKRIK